jgi:hypothetical protein
MTAAVVDGVGMVDVEYDVHTEAPEEDEYPCAYPTTTHLLTHPTTVLILTHASRHYNTQTRNTQTRNRPACMCLRVYAST